MDSDSGEIFISYKSERRRAAAHLARTLKHHGYTVWFDYELIKGKGFARQIDARIRGAKALIVLWCTMSVRSEWVEEEVDLAKQLGILIPTKIEACEPVIGDRKKQFVNLIDWDGSPRSPQLDDLLNAIAQKVGRRPAPDYDALREYDDTWRQFGRPPLRAFALETPLEPTAGRRSLADAGGSPAPPPPPAPSVVRRPTAEERYRAEGRIEVDCPPELVHGAPAGWFLPGAGKAEWFSDIAGGPEIVVVPRGSFDMGTAAAETAALSAKWKEEASDVRKLLEAEGPQHRVVVERPFAVGRHAVTRGQFAAFLEGTGQNAKSWTSWLYLGFAQDDSHPVVRVTWDEATAYVNWLSEVTRKHYRLLSEAEWEYCCRAGTTTRFWWGPSITTEQANYKGKYAGTMPVESFAANNWGLWQVHGNVWEWCEDIWHNSYEENRSRAPTDGSAWLESGDAGCCVVRGGAWIEDPEFCRAACRSQIITVQRNDDCGFRVGRTL